jgi:hypothetical protein
MEIITDGPTLATAIKRAVKAIMTMQDRVHELAVSSMYHYWEHGDSTYLTNLGSGISKCNGVNKQKFIGYVSETCGLNWDVKNNRFKKAKNSTFTKSSGQEIFPHPRLEAERWYEFELGSEMPSWMLKKALRQLNAQISTHTDEAKDQIDDAYEEFVALKNTMSEVGLGEGQESFSDDTPEWLHKAA